MCGFLLLSRLRRFWVVIQGIVSLWAGAQRLRVGHTGYRRLCKKNFVGIQDGQECTCSNLVPIGFERRSQTVGSVISLLNRDGHERDIGMEE